METANSTGLWQDLYPWKLRSVSGTFMRMCISSMLCGAQTLCNCNFLDLSFGGFFQQQTAPQIHRSWICVVEGRSFRPLAIVFSWCLPVFQRAAKKQRKLRKILELRRFTEANAATLGSQMLVAWPQAGGTVVFCSGFQRAASSSIGKKTDLTCCVFKIADFGVRFWQQNHLLRQQLPISIPRASCIETSRRWRCWCLQWRWIDLSWLSVRLRKSLFFWPHTGLTQNWMTPSKCFTSSSADMMDNGKDWVPPMCSPNQEFWIGRIQATWHCCQAENFLLSDKSPTSVAAWIKRFRFGPDLQLSALKP